MPARPCKKDAGLRDAAGALHQPVTQTGQPADETGVVFALELEFTKFYYE
jgi:hypothetical protein